MVTDVQDTHSVCRLVRLNSESGREPVRLLLDKCLHSTALGHIARC